MRRAGLCTVLVTLAPLDRALVGRCARARGFLVFAWESSGYSSHGRNGMDPCCAVAGRVRRPGFGEAYNAAGYCPRVVRCRTWAYPT